MDTEAKLIHLEEQAYFQEKLLSQLNEALLFQQAQIDLLEKRIAELEQNVTSLLESSPQDAPVNTPPPHYMPERY